MTGRDGIVFLSDDDECTLGIDTCTHACHDTPGSYTCSCESGFAMDADGHTCNGIVLYSKFVTPIASLSAAPQMWTSAKLGVLHVTTTATTRLEAIHVAARHCIRSAVTATHATVPLALLLLLGVWEELSY